MEPDLLDAGAGIIPGTTQNADYFSAAPLAGSFGTVGGTGAGQHGVTPSASGSGNGGSMMGAITSVWDWLNQPFSQRMSPMTVFAWTGAVIIAIIVWNMILYHIRIAAESI